ncbi:MAG: methylmalonate semialdehyde dehydrogenase [acylating] 1 [Gemmatimonadota bacterium]|nr:MAG: methylmalonate semialdehyde dehydrogenase [acylating] 1 [Gemmatimonadota bacterium]
MVTETGVERLQNYVDGRWIDVAASQTQQVRNPATGAVIAEVPLGGAAEVDAAVQAAHRAYASWREVPPIQRARYLFEFKNLLEKNFEELAATLTREHGKTLHESRGSVRRGIECVEVAAGAPSLLMGMAIEDVATGIDCESIRQPLGVFACIAPFNFPAMVPLWFYPFAVACGNTFVCKPSEQVPLCQRFMFQLIEDAGFPPGVLNLVNGGKDVVNAILEHPLVEGVSFVGSSPVAAHVYRTAAEHGKRVQALGGAKNFLVVMPDAEMDKALDAITESAYGCAGQRCLAGSVVLAVGDAHDRVRDGLAQRARALVMGDGAQEGTDMGPVISATHRKKVLDYIDKGVAEGANMVVDGRERTSEEGFFVGPTLFDGVTPDMVIAKEEIFGPVLCVSTARDLDDALEIIRQHPLANATSIFTTSGKHARDFKYRVTASMTAVNLGVAAPMSFFGFGGAKGSFFGDLKAHGREAFDFFTDKKIVISRW